MKNIIYFLFAGFIISCSSNQQETSVPERAINDKIVVLTEQQFLNSKLTTGKLTKGEMSSVLKLNGSIEATPQNTFSITMPLGGYIKNSQLVIGTKVAKGQALFQMNDPQYIQLQQDFLTANARLLYLQTELERQTTLNISKAVSDKVLQQTQMEFSTQNILVSALTEKLKIINIKSGTLTEKSMTGNITIESPINGFISKVNFNNGKYASPTDILAEIINNDNLTLQIQVFEKDLDKLKIGQQVIATNNNSDKKYPCTIQLISQNLTSERTAAITCEFDKSSAELFPGMYMNAEIVIANVTALSIPESAIVDFEGKSYVFLLQLNNQYLMQEINKGISSSGLVEILNHEAIGNSDVVIDGAYTLLMALKNKSED